MSLAWGSYLYPPQRHHQSQNLDLSSCDQPNKQQSNHFDPVAKIGASQQQNVSYTITETYPYEPSIASSASSSVSSVFSDTASQTSSTSSTSQTDADEASLERQNAPTAPTGLGSTAFFPGVYHGQPQLLGSKNPGITIQVPPGPVTIDQRQHPRRCSLAEGKQPPQLVRQSVRKVNFVDNLVDSATQMVEVIWPLSVVPCRSEASNGRGVLPLRTFIQETLRRSRTSYSTLQVALYYLILIKPHVPKCDFTMEQPGDNESFRALQCGRRMFLASLILASKYLQDRNFSARAWSKISGLKTQEINTNEMTFLNAINWSLHIPEGIFERWTDIVLKYTPPSQATDASCPPTARSCSSWKSIVLRLTPRLDTVELPTTSPTSAKFSWVNNGIQNLHLPSTPTPTSEAFGSTSQEGTPTPSSNKILLEDRLKKKPSMSSLTTPPRFLEPKPDMPPPTPHLARMGPLPTPQLTPSSVASNTPAVGISSCASSRRPSMASCMAQAKNVCLARTAYDHWITPASAPTKGNSCGLEQYSLSRRSSVARSTSSGSSPESMISDLTSRSSRASSISSVSSAPNWAPTCKLARLATCRNAKLPVLGQGFTQPSKDGNGMVNIVDSDLARPEAIISEEGFVPSPESLDYFSLPQPSAAIKMPLRRKPSVMLPNPSTPQKQRPVARTACSSPLKPEPFHGRKRGRSSTDFSLQQNVRDLLCAAPSKPTSTPVRPDMRRADSSSSVRSCSAILSRNTNISTLPIRSALSFANSNSGSVTPCAKRDEDETEDDDATPVTSGHGKRGPQSPHANRNPRMPVEKDVAGKKRACCCAEEERKRTSCGREGSFRMEGRPGMWEGVL